MNIEYTKRAQKQLKKFPTDTAKRIVGKIRWYRLQKDPLSFAEPLTKPKYGKYKFRIGDYRVIFDVKGKEIQVLFVLSIKHRSKVYEDV